MSENASYHERLNQAATFAGDGHGWNRRYRFGLKLMGLELRNPPLADPGCVIAPLPFGSYLGWPTDSWIANTDRAASREHGDDNG